MFFGTDFFYFFELGLISGPGSCILYYSNKHWGIGKKFKNSQASGGRLFGTHEWVELNK